MPQKIIEQGTYRSDIAVTLTEIDARRGELAITMDNIPCQDVQAGDPPIPHHSIAKLSPNVFATGNTSAHFFDNGDGTLRLEVVLNIAIKRPGSAGSALRLIK